MALELFANFERTGTGNNNIFYRPTTELPFQCILRLLDESSSLTDQVNLANNFYARYSLNYGQTTTHFDLVTGVELRLQRSFPRIYPITVYLYSLDDFQLQNPVTTYTLSAAFIRTIPKANFLAYPGLVLNEETGEVLQLNQTNYTESKGVSFYGEGHTEVVYLSTNLVANDACVDSNYIEVNPLQYVPYVADWGSNVLWPYGQNGVLVGTYPVTKYIYQHSSSPIAVDDNFHINGQVLDFQNYAHTLFNGQTTLLYTLPANTPLRLNVSNDVGGPYGVGSGKLRLYDCPFFGSSLSGSQLSIRSNWFIGNSINDTTKSVYKVYDTANPNISKVIFKTESAQAETIPITVCITNDQMPLVPTPYYYDDYTGEKKMYDFFASSLTVDGERNPANTKYKDSIEIKPYPELNDLQFFTPFRTQFFSLPYNYEDAIFTARVSAIPINTVFYSQLTGTTWKISATQDSFTKEGNWSSQTNTLPNINAYQFPIGYDPVYKELPSTLKTSSVNDTLLTLQVSCHKQIGLFVPPFDWKVRTITTVYEDKALIAALPFVKITTPNYFNLLDQKILLPNNTEIYGTKFFLDTSNINQDFEVIEVSVFATNFDDYVHLVGDNLHKPFYINFTKTGTQSLTAVALLWDPSSQEEPFEITNEFLNITETLIEFDNISKGENFYKSTLTELNLSLSASPVLSPNEWAVEDNINNSISSLYNCIDELKRSLFRYQPTSFLYGWMGNNKYTWTDLECETENISKLSWEENTCPSFNDPQTYVVSPDTYNPFCPPITFLDIVTLETPVVYEINTTWLSGRYTRSYGFGFNAFYYTRFDSKYIVVSPNAWVIPQQRQAITWEYYEIISENEWQQIGVCPSLCPLVLPPSGYNDVSVFENPLGVIFVKPQPTGPTPTTPRSTATPVPTPTLPLATSTPNPTRTPRPTQTSTAPTPTAPPPTATLVTDLPPCDPEEGSGIQSTIRIDSIKSSAVKPDKGFHRLTSCTICVEVEVDSNGIVTIARHSGQSTNYKDLSETLAERGLIPPVSGTYTFMFEFYGWRKKAKLSYPGANASKGIKSSNSTIIRPAEWYSADDQFDIWTDTATAQLLNRMPTPTPTPTITPSPTPTLTPTPTPVFVEINLNQHFPAGGFNDPAGWPYGNGVMFGPYDELKYIYSHRDNPVIVDDNLFINNQVVDERLTPHTIRDGKTTLLLTLPAGQTFNVNVRNNGGTYGASGALRVSTGLFEQEP
jgi:hypothetical protein